MRSPMVALNALCQLLHCPLLTDSAKHGLQLVLMEGVQRLHREDIIEPLPAFHEAGSVQLPTGAVGNILYGDQQMQMREARLPGRCSASMFLL